MDAVLRRVLRAAPATTWPSPHESERQRRLGAALRQGAGEAIASHARARYLKAGVLHLSVDSPVWLQELTFLRREIATKVMAALGEPIHDVKLSLARRPLPPVPPSPRMPAPPPAPGPPPELPPEARARIVELSAGLEDPDLKAAMERAMARWRARKG
jgi:hypothetical protein